MTRHTPEKHHRRSIRLQGYDYAQSGAYFLTICTRERECLFGEVLGEEMRLSDAAQVVETCWLAIPDHFPHVELDAFVSMPNHVHGIIWIREDGENVVGANTLSDTVGAGLVGAKDFSPLPQPSRTSPQQPPSDQPDTTAFRSPSRTVGSIVRGFKIGVTKWVRANTEIHDVWQRNYYEHIVRDDADLNRIRQYIADNPARWAEDTENPENKGRRM